MRLRDVLTLTAAKLMMSDADLDVEIRCCFAAYLMSDVLRYDLTQSLLISGLANPQVVRTAEMADVVGVLMVRGKTPLPETLALAAEVGIPFLVTSLTMFESCGRLYAAGLLPGAPCS
jgi:hypothetical protein